MDGVLQRFFLQGNNLFGIRTFDPNVPNMKPLDNPNAEFGVKIYLHPCDSVLDMVSILKHSKNFVQFREIIYNGFSLYSFFNLYSHGLKIQVMIKN